MSNPFAQPRDGQAQIRYAVRIQDRGRPFHLIVVNLTVPRMCTPNRIKEMLNRKIIDYIQLRFPAQLGLTAVILGRVDHEL